MWIYTHKMVRYGGLLNSKSNVKAVLWSGFLPVRFFDSIALHLTHPIRNKLKTNALCQYAQRYKLICTRMIIIEKEREEREER
jgi:hypothetical protein